MVIDYSICQAARVFNLKKKNRDPFRVADQEGSVKLYRNTTQILWLLLSAHSDDKLWLVFVCLFFFCLPEIRFQSSLITFSFKTCPRNIFYRTFPLTQVVWRIFDLDF